MSDLPDYQITRVWTPQKMGKGTTCLCSFAFAPPKLSPVKVKSSYEVEGKDGKKHRDRVDAEIDGAHAVRINTAFVRTSKQGELYIWIPCGIDIPWQLSTKIAQECVDMLDERNKRDESKAKGKKE